MKTLRGTILAAAAALAAAVVFADKDVYDNEIQYESDGHTVKYQFWYDSQTAEALSSADAVSASASPAADFEPRYFTRAVSDGECPAYGMLLIIR